MNKLMAGGFVVLILAGGSLGIENVLHSRRPIRSSKSLFKKPRKILQRGIRNTALDKANFPYLSLISTAAAANECAVVNPATANSATSTPTSKLFGGGGVNSHIPLNLPGTVAAKTADIDLSAYNDSEAFRVNKSYRIVELRGWLRSVGDSCNGNDPDWHYELEIDPAWTDKLGIKLNQLIRVGQIFGSSTSIPDDEATNRVTIDYGENLTNYKGSDAPVSIAPPLVHIEFNGYPDNSLKPPPNLWSWSPFDHQDICSYAYPAKKPCPSEPYSCRLYGGQPGTTVLWTYDPLNPICGQPRLIDYKLCSDTKYQNLHPKECGLNGAAADPDNPGWYVRVVGSISTDHPHLNDIPFFDTASWCAFSSILCFSNSDRENSLKYIWSNGLGNRDESNYARWTEIHPPDLIAILPYQPRKETVRVVSILTRPSRYGEVRRLQYELTPPNPQPFPSARLDYSEEVGPETDLSTIIAGNNTKTGAKLTRSEKSIVTEIFIRNLFGDYGKFKAIYRVGWVWDNGKITVQKTGSGNASIVSQWPTVTDGIDCGSRCSAVMPRETIYLSIKVDNPADGSYISFISPAGAWQAIAKDHLSADYAISLKSSDQTVTVGLDRCSPPSTHCGAACVDLQTNTDNCGRCGFKCAAGLCRAGKCDVPCVPKCTVVFRGNTFQMCGTYDDGCGGTCVCPTGLTCRDHGEATLGWYCD